MPAAMLHAAPTPRRFTLAGLRMAGLLAGLLLMLACASALAQRQTFDSALAVESAGAAFPTDVPARTVALPDDWSLTRPDSDGPVWYRVSFTAPRSNALQTCQTGGMGDLPSTGLTAADEELLGPSVTHVDGMRTCSSTWPENSAWDRLVVIAPGDPATVHVAISKMGR